MVKTGICGGWITVEDVRHLAAAAVAQFLQVAAVARLRFIAVIGKQVPIVRIGNHWFGQHVAHNVWRVVAGA